LSINGGKNIESEIDWIENENPWWELKFLFKIFIIFIIIMIISLILGLYDMYWLGKKDIDSIWFKVFYFSLIPGGMGLFSLFMSHRLSIRAIHINEQEIILKFTYNRIKNFSWDQIKNVVIGFEKETTIWIREGNTTHQFDVNKFTYDNLLNYYQKSTGRPPITREEFFKSD
jgi:hypothetical protein